MPYDRSKYPADWDKIAARIKDNANWTCEHCGKPCRKPGVPWVDFVGWLLNDVPGEWYDLTRDEVWDECGKAFIQKERPQRFTLTVAHMNHEPMDCRDENLKALCSTCHVRYDAPMKAARRVAKRQQQQQEQGQLSLMGVE